MKIFSTVKNIHFVGIGGIGMSGIAEILLNQGFNITGSDMRESENTKYLENLGAKVFIGHNAENINDAEVVVYSSAVDPKENPETNAALQKGIPTIKRAVMLAEVARLNYCLAISGTHGKTTTTSMLGLILIKAGIDPTVIVGGRLRDFGGTNARLGKGKWTVVEADEYDRSFMQLSPTIAIVNNIEEDHLDIYKDIDDIKHTFTDFANLVPFYGLVSLGIDDSGVKEVLSKINKKIVTFGLSRNADYSAENIRYESGKTIFEAREFDKLLGEIELSIPGLHNIKNALASISVARQMDIDFATIKASLFEFGGVYRRFDIKGEANGIMVVDDYAHHPSEVSTTLEAAGKGWNRRVVAAFQPHTFTRTKEMYKEFAASFDHADVLIVTDVYPAREKPIEGVTGKLIADAAKDFGHKNVLYFENLDDMKEELPNILKNGDIFITLGAGNIVNVADYIYSELKENKI
jgi:UDP-N-acetylmuramate--alanine ligase